MRAVTPCRRFGWFAAVSIRLLSSDSDDKSKVVADALTVNDFC
jgi:hypothetical protein